MGSVWATRESAHIQANGSVTGPSARSGWSWPKKGVTITLIEIRGERLRNSLDGYQDIFSGEIVGYAMGEHLTRNLVGGSAG